MKRRSSSKILTANIEKGGADASESPAAGSTRQMVIDATPKIIEALILKAQAGSYLHARMLFEFAGLTGVCEPSEAESPLVEILMKELGLSLPPDPKVTRPGTEGVPPQLPSSSSTLCETRTQRAISGAGEPFRRDANKPT